MKGIILYKSKYGAARKYAEWLAEETGFKKIEIGKAKLSELELCDVIVIGGGVYASGIAGLDFLRRHIDRLRDKKILVFCNGASPYEERAFEEIRQRNMKDRLKDIPLFYCRGQWDMDSMTVIDRSLCRMLRKATAKKDPADYEVWEAALMAAGEEKCDWTDRSYLKPILEKIHEME